MRDHSRIIMPVSKANLKETGSTGTASFWSPCIAGYRKLFESCASHPSIVMLRCLRRRLSLMLGDGGPDEANENSKSSFPSGST
jgi:hypothetical protein